jgi:hypothetical protein
MDRLIEVGSFWINKGASLRQLVEAFEQKKLGGAAAAGGKGEPAVDSQELKQMLETILANQEKLAAGQLITTAAAAAGAGPSSVVAPTAAAPTPEPVLAKKKGGRTPKAAPSPNKFAVLEEDPATSNWVLPAGIKGRLVGALADLLETTLQQPALAGATEPALLTAVTKALESFVVTTTKATRAANKWKHVETVYTNLMPKEHKAGATATELVSAMAAHIVLHVMKASPSA